MVKKRPGGDGAREGSPWYRLADMCRLFDCAPRTIWTWVSEGKLPQPVRNGSRWTRWPKEVVDELLKTWAQPKR